MSSPAVAPVNSNLMPRDRSSFGAQLAMFWRALLKSPAGLLGAAIVVLVIFTAVAGPIVAPYDPYESNLRSRFKAPNWGATDEPVYLLGTDQLGRDILSRVIYGSRISVMVGVSAVIISGIIGLFLGLISAYFGGILDALLMRIADAFLGIPFIIMVVAVAGLVGGGLWTIILILGLTGWVAYARVVRSETFSIREREFILATRAIGQRQGAIIFRHVMPNIMSSVIIMATLEVSRAIVAESTLSFLGLGVLSPTITWGNMLADGRDYVGSAWWMVTFPGLAITITVLGVVLLGDWMRDILDPRLRQ